MIISTTNSIEGKTIKKYLGVINSNIVIGTNLFSDFAAALTDVFGGTSGSYKSKLSLIYDQVMNELKAKAEKIKADAVVGLHIDFDEISGGGKSMFMVSATGTAVLFWDKLEDRYSMYRALEQIYDFKTKGILTEEEYEFEQKRIKSIYANNIKSELDTFNEQMAAEKVRMAEEERLKAEALKTADEIIQDKFTLLQDGVPSNIDEETVLTANYDDLDFDSNDPIQYSVARFLRFKRFPEACKLYMDETGLEDVSNAVDFCLDVHKQLVNINKEAVAVLLPKLKVLKKRGFMSQAISEYQKATYMDSISAKEFIDALTIE